MCEVNVSPTGLYNLVKGKIVFRRKHVAVHWKPSLHLNGWTMNHIIMVHII